MSSESQHILTLTELLHEEPAPKELEITILPFPDDDTAKSSFMKDGIHLGIHAPNVPEIARDFRKYYYNSRHIVISDGHYCHADRQMFMDCISCLLLLCPDHATAWADRRRLSLARKSSNSNSHTRCCISFWEVEMLFLDMLFTQHSKAPNAWGYRRWVCRQIIKELKQDFTEHGEDLSDQVMRWAIREIAVCSVIAEKYPKNYYAWTHRRFIVNSLMDMMQHNNGEFDDSVRSMIEGEISCIESWLPRHVSDHSAAHYGGEMITLFLQVGSGSSTSIAKKFKWGMGVMREKMQISKELIEKFSSHEVIWAWRRICSHLLLEQYNTVSDCTESLSFVRGEVLYALSAIELSCKKHSDEKEQTMVQHFSTAYILWLLKYAKCNNIELSLITKDLSVVKKSLFQMQSFRSMYLKKIWAHAASEL